jgi:putative salt-induced outer membrane protein YdiY
MIAILCRVVLIVTASAALLLPPEAIAREKTDIVFLVNGDRLTGEILELEYGQLSVKTDSLGTVQIEWLDVARIETLHVFSVESNTGDRYSGAISPGIEGGHIVVVGTASAVDLAVSEVARIGQLEAGFIERLNGSVSLGFDQTKSSDVSTLTFVFDSEYRSDKNIASLNGNFTSNDTADQGTFNQYGVTFGNQFLRPGDQFWLALASYESNEQQGIDGRLLMGAARGKYLIRRQDSELATYAGVGFTQEWAASSADDQQSVEGLLGVQWKIFRFRDPETSLTSQLLLLPGLTETGRYRARANISLRHEIVNDLYLDLTFNGNYDNEPPTEGSEPFDYTVSTSLGYKF